jgi:isoleucyl-tRNA synthetase
VVDELFRHLTIWLAPVLVFTAEEAWWERYPQVRAAGGSVHLQVFTPTPAHWHDAALAAKWETIRDVRRVVTGALEVQRAAKVIGSSLEASPVVHVTDAAMQAALAGVDLAELCITSGLDLVADAAPADAFQLADVPGVAVSFRKADGIKCARSWKYFDPASADPAFPDITPRDAAAMRELIALGRA